MKALFHGSAEAGHEGTEEHGAFDAEPEAFGVLAKEGGGEFHTLQKAMFDATTTLRMENVTRLGGRCTRTTRGDGLIPRQDRAGP